MEYLNIKKNNIGYKAMLQEKKTTKQQENKFGCAMIMITQLLLESYVYQFVRDFNESSLFNNYTLRKIQKRVLPFYKQWKERTWGLMNKYQKAVFDISATEILQEKTILENTIKNNFFKYNFEEVDLMTSFCCLVNLCKVSQTITKNYGFQNSTAPNELMGCLMQFSKENKLRSYSISEKNIGIDEKIDNDILTCISNLLNKMVEVLTSEINKEVVEEYLEED